MKSVALFVVLGFFVGCESKATQPKTSQAKTTQPSSPSKSEPDKVSQERAKLTPEDQKLVDAQEWCVVSTEERLGSMGPPIKLTIEGEPVFICCKGCKRKAEDNPAKTLQTLRQLKAKVGKQN